MQTPTVNKELILEKQNILRRLEEIESLISDNLYKNGCMVNKPIREGKMDGEVIQPVEQVKVEVPKLSVADRAAKALEMLKAKKDLKEIMTTLGVSNTYVYKIKKANNLL